MCRKNFVSRTEKYFEKALVGIEHCRGVALLCTNRRPSHNSRVKRWEGSNATPSPILFVQSMRVQSVTGVCVDQQPQQLGLRPIEAQPNCDIIRITVIFDRQIVWVRRQLELHQRWESIVQAVQNQKVCRNFLKAGTSWVDRPMNLRNCFLGRISVTCLIVHKKLAICERKAPTSQPPFQAMSAFRC